MTEFDIIIEATRRGFLKQAAGAIAASVTPIKLTKTALSIPTYDITPVISNTHIMQRIYDTVSRGSKIPFEEWYRQVLHSLSNGQGIKDSLFVKEVVAEFMADTNEGIDVLDSILKQTELTPGNELDHFMGEVWQGDWCNPNYSNTGRNFLDVVPASDIVYNGKVVYSKESLLKAKVLPDASTVVKTLQDLEKDFAEDLAANLAQNEIDAEEYEAELNRNRDDDDDGSDEERDDNEDHHSQLGIRRDSAWYESVLKEQDEV